MMTLKQTARLLARPLVAFTVLALIYTILIFTLPPNHKTMEAYNLTPLGFRIIYFSMVIPSLITWFTSFFGYAKLREYANSISQTVEGEDYSQLARGATWLAWSLPLASIAAIILSGAANRWSNFLPTAVIISHYINLILPLVAFTIIGSAARRLTAHAKLKFAPQASRFIIILFVVAGVSYCLLTFRWFDLSNLTNTHNPYYLPLWLVLLTISIPYLYAWFVAMLASYEISLFRRHVSGLLYKNALRYLAVGLIVVVLSSIGLQYITAADPRFGKLIFDAQLLISIIFRLIRAIGFVLIIIGATRLKRIEEV